MTSQRRRDERDSLIGNPEVVAFALYELGGAGRFIGIEDLFVRCWQLAPRRFSWRTKEYPNYKTLYQALVDLERSHAGTLIRTTDGLGRQLSASGVAWVRQREARFRRALAQPSEGMSGRRPSHRLVNELSSAEPVRQFRAGEEPKLSRFDAADLLVASPDSPPSVWRERLAIYRSAVESAGRPDLQEFLDYVESRWPEWFAGGEK